MKEKKSVGGGEEKCWSVEDGEGGVDVKLEWEVEEGDGDKGNAGDSEEA